MTRRLVLVAGAIVVAFAVLVAGPDRLVVCGTGNVLDRAAQRVAGGGHVDGPDASRCSVPSAAAWAVAGIALAGGAVLAIRPWGARGRLH